MYEKTKWFSFQSKNNFDFPAFVAEKKIVVRSRISMSENSHNFRYPIDLSSNHNVTSRIIKEKHKKIDHARVQILMSTLGAQFWIIRCRKTLLQRSIQSKRFFSKAVEILSVPLPQTGWEVLVFSNLLLLI